MPGTTTYTRRNRRSRYRPKKTADYIRRKNSAKDQANQLLRLNKQVSSLTIANRQKNIWQQFFMENEFPQVPDTPTPLVLPYKFSTVPLVRPDKWSPCFQSSTGTTGTEDFGDKFMGQSMDLQLRFALTDNALSLPQTIIHMWLVKMRNDTGNQALRDTLQLQTTLAGGGSFNNGSLCDRRYWIDTTIKGDATSTTPSGLVKLNKTAFDVLYHRKFQMGNQLNNTALEDAQVTTSLASTVRNYRIRIPYRNHIKSALGEKTQPSDVQGWKALEREELEPKDQVFLICHVNYPSVGVTDPTTIDLSYNVVFNGRVNTAASF
ncbi:MAG: putative capsid protein [Cressdnaviricota sp.]|nr:MAG: putative capsid protein [Cressdnaviricota sp.]